MTTATPKTIDAFRDHGLVRVSLEENLDDARSVVETLDLAGISLWM